MELFLQGKTSVQRFAALEWMHKHFKIKCFVLIFCIEVSLNVPFQLVKYIGTQFFLVYFVINAFSILLILFCWATSEKKAPPKFALWLFHFSIQIPIVSASIPPKRCLYRDAPVLSSINGIFQTNFFNSSIALQVEIETLNSLQTTSLLSDSFPTTFVGGFITLLVLGK